MNRVNGVLTIQALDESRNGRFMIGATRCYGSLPVTVTTGTTVSAINERMVRGACTVSDVRSEQPKTREDIVRFLTSTFHGIGPKKAGLLAQAGSMEQVQALLDDEKALAKVLPAADAASVSTAWQESKVVRRELGWLMAQAAITPAMQTRIMEHYGIKLVQKGGTGTVAQIPWDRMKLAWDKVKQNPYSLMDVPGIGFKKADMIAQRLGIPPNSPMRAAAFVTEVLQQNEEKGHCYMRREAFEQELARNVGVGEWVIDDLIEQARATQVGDLICRQVTRSMENKLAAAVIESLAKILRPVGLGGYMKLSPVKLHAKQRAVGDMVDTHRISFLTGGPGTGKTHTLGLLVKAAQERGVTVVACAPTGKAASRMSEKMAIPARTIHATLQWAPGGIPRLEEPLDPDLLIIDEASMLDLEMAYNIFTHVSPETRILFVGDPDQIPSVGAGNFLADMLAIPNVERITLTHVFRQAEGSGVALAAQAIREGRIPAAVDGEVMLMEPGDDLDSIDAGDYFMRALESARLRFNGLPQILTPGHKGNFGTERLNKMVLEKMGGEETGHIQSGAKVIQTANNYQLPTYVLPPGAHIDTHFVDHLVQAEDCGVFNGETGVVALIEDNRVYVNFGNKFVAYTMAQANKMLSPAFCLTIHKCQGSEYPAVLLHLGRAHTHMMTRNLFYTAVTRAAKAIIIMADRATLEKAVKVHYRDKRLTLLTKQVCG